MTDVSIHWLTQDTVPLLAETEMFDGPVLPASLDAFVADPNHHLVFAVSGARAIGFAAGCVIFQPDKPPCFFISEVGVDGPYRKRGIGKRLTDLLIRRARDIGCKGIWLATEQDNGPARALYASLAARETDGIVVYDWDGAMDAHGVD